MSYLVLARKYRPQRFDEVIGQEHITHTLGNAISSNRVAHAILFSGPRGTGKTTVARILAKAMNCKEGPTPNPCNACRSCREIKSGSAVDVFEIDGASNNSVDQIRELREYIKYMPAHSPYKIYIIDEVHMLSIAAFNALLKTLEEPPSHILFMFATTESHKIPVTILSRCQRHDFKRIGIESIQKQMEMICQKEQLQVSEESLFLIAREAGGSLRDALSLLDQIMTCSEGSIEAEDVTSLLGITDRSLLFDMSEAVLSANISSVLDILDSAYDRGFDMKKLFADLVEHFRNLLVVKIGKKSHQLVDLQAHEIDQINHQTKDVSAAYLSQLFGILLNEEAAVRFSSQPKLVVEMAFLKLCQIKPALSVDDLIEKLDNLREEISGGVKQPEKVPPPPSGNPPQGKPAEIPESIKDPVLPESPVSFGSPDPSASSDSPGASDSPGSPGSIGDAKKEEPVENLDRLWKKIIETASDKQPMLAAALSKCNLNSLTDEGLEIIVNGSDFNMNLIRRPKNKVALKKVVKDLLGRDVPLLFKTRKNKDPNNQKKKEHENRLKQEALGHPLVAETLEIFNGKIVDVKIL